MKEYYRIGETASLMGITTQTLRFYDKIGLVKPIKIDPRIGYRYYAYEQFHFIDRIKYLQSLGMPLDDIKEVMLSKKVERLLPFLDQQKKVLEEEEKKIRHQIEMVDWYKDYFTYMERNEDAPCVMHLKERYYLQVPCYKRDLLADMEIRLAKEKSEQGIDNAMYLRQYGYKISYDAFCKQKFRPDYYFIYLNEKVKDAPNILKLPEGDYLCFRERILEEAWNPQRIISYFQGKAKPELIKQVHKNYFKAGADCGITCSYQASIPGLMENGYTLEEAENLIRSAVKIFCEARDEWQEEEGREAGRAWPLCLGAAGPYGAYLADGSEYRGNYGITDEQLKEFHKRRVELLHEAGADIILFETVPSLKEAKVEAEIAEEYGYDYWISFSCLSENIICEGTPIAECAKTFAKGYPHLKMIGVNCTKPEYITGLIHKIKENCDIPIGVYPNSGEEYDAVKKVWFGKQSALSFEQYAYNYMKSGASAVGGCCTTVAKHVEEVVRAKKRFSEEQK